MDPKILRKIQRKLKHCEGVLYKNEGVLTSSKQTNALFIGNGGIGCGISEDSLTKIFSQFGCIRNIVSPLNKPYSFVVYENEENAASAMQCIFGKKLESGNVFYLSYISEDNIPKRIQQKPLWPEGLHLLKEFISEDEEKTFLSIFKCDDSFIEKTVMKHRTVKHYGYEFIYGSNLIDINKPLKDKIPEVCIPHLKKLVELGYLKKVPEQMTLNYYLPGQGIPPHIDTHSCFDDGIVSLSLGSEVAMEFSCGENVTSVILPRRSALIMLGESRYLWKHGITPRKTDVMHVDGSDESSLLIHNRSPRTSLTFRIIRNGKCNCEYKQECNSHEKSTVLLDSLSNSEAVALENEHVNQVYEKIADHFSLTRYKPWPKVEHFLKNIPSGSFVLDIGCGNGKNMKLTSGCFEVGCDASSNLASLCSKRNIECLVADCLRLPFRDNCVDIVICIAVIHHLSSEIRRCTAIREILRVLKSHGRALVYVWAFEQNGPQSPSKYLKPSKVHSSSSKHNGEALKAVVKQKVTSKCIQMTVHENRTDFFEQDILVPWKSANQTENHVYHRYYHVFVQGELEALVNKCDGKIESLYYDQGNWCIIFEKK